MNINGKIEKIVDTHKGATLNAKWSNDGSGFITSKFFYILINKKFFNKAEKMVP